MASVDDVKLRSVLRANTQNLALDRTRRRFSISRPGEFSTRGNPARSLIAVPLVEYQLVFLLSESFTAPAVIGGSRR